MDTNRVRLAQLKKAVAAAKKVQRRWIEKREAYLLKLTLEGQLTHPVALYRTWLYRWEIDNATTKVQVYSSMLKEWERDSRTA